MGVFNSGSIMNPVNQLRETGQPFADMGIVGQILNPAGYAFAKPASPNAGVFDAGGPVNTMLDPLDIFGGQRAAQLNDASNYDPNAPGSIFNMGKPVGRLYQPSSQPAPGTPTNGLANGTRSGGIDWAPIIARALRKS